MNAVTMVFTTDWLWPFVLVAMALVDCKIDSRERKLLQSAATHLGLQGRLDEFIR